MDSQKIRAHRQALLKWYHEKGRSLPWRIRPEDRKAGHIADPYAVWLSEIMLQQTTVPHATPYWQAFLERWPNVHDLAGADRGDVLAAWAGLGYYARARNLHACAHIISTEHDGKFPIELKDLLSLPGIGDYTANAIRASAFNKPASVVDGNVERVITRMFAIQTSLPKAKPEIKKIAAGLADPDYPCDYAQAIMDLGATVCTPKTPQCDQCPWQDSCQARLAGTMLKYPIKAKKKPKPTRYGVCYFIVYDNKILVRRRPETGLLGGMLELPGSDWSDERTDLDPPFKASWTPLGRVHHVFTHFSLNLDVLYAQACASWTVDKAQWVKASELGTIGLPSLMVKAASLGLKAIKTEC